MCHAAQAGSRTLKKRRSGSLASAFTGAGYGGTGALARDRSAAAERLARLDSGEAPSHATSVVRTSWAFLFTSPSTEAVWHRHACPM